MIGEIAIPILPLSPEGSPRLISRQVFPPSVDLWIPDPGPPSIIVHWWRRRCHEVAYITPGLRGSKWTSFTPVCSSTSRTRSHVSPPSVVRYSPRSPPAAHRGPCAATYTVRESSGWIAIIPMWREVSSPMLVNESPPSTDL